jgi:hypothetical protein
MGDRDYFKIGGCEVKRWKNASAVAIVLTFMVTAVPQLHLGTHTTPATFFACMWVLFAMLILSAHLYKVLCSSEPITKPYKIKYPSQHSPVPAKEGTSTHIQPASHL